MTIDWRKALDYLNARLAEPSTRICLSVVVVSLFGDVVPELAGAWVDIAVLMLNLLVAGLPDRGSNT